MTIQDELNLIIEEKDQRTIALKARKRLAEVSQKIKDLNSELTIIINEGSFNTLPDNLKGTLARWRNIMLKAQQDMQADKEIIEAFLWTPTTD